MTKPRKRYYYVVEIREAGIALGGIAVAHSRNTLQSSINGLQKYFAEKMGVDVESVYIPSIHRI